MTTFNWSVVSLERIIATGLVRAVHYEVVATSADELYTASLRGVVGLDPGGPGPVVPYPELTPELCLGWIQAKLGTADITAIEDGLQQQLDLMAAPVIAQGVPWALPYQPGE